MAKMARTVGVAMAAAMALAGNGRWPDPILMVVVQVEDHYGVAIEALREAQHEAARIYAAIGLSLVWVNKGADRSHVPDGTFWLDVALLSESRTEALVGRSLVPKTAFGLSYEKRPVYIFCGRIARRASTRESFENILGRVLAHEIGHKLLPSRGHSDRGIMRSSVNFGSQEPPAFTRAQAAAIRVHLVPSR